MAIAGILCAFATGRRGSANDIFVEFPDFSDRSSLTINGWAGENGPSPLGTLKLTDYKRQASSAYLTRYFNLGDIRDYSRAPAVSAVNKTVSGVKSACSRTPNT